MADLDDLIAARREFAWKVLGRFDQYISLFNTKSSITIAYQALLVSSVVVKATEIVQNLKALHPELAKVSALSIATIVVCGVVATGFALWAIKPNLSNDPAANPSLLYFPHVAAQFGKYKPLSDRYSELSEQKMLDEVCGQHPALAKVAADKAWVLNIASIAMLVQSGGLLVLVVCHAVAFLQDVSW